MTYWGKQAEALMSKACDPDRLPFTTLSEFAPELIFIEMEVGSSGLL